MDYLYENLGDERFQEFCYILISKEFPNTQAFPVGQPDGGRDAIVFSMERQKKDFIVFQVKYVRNPDAIKDVHKWLTEIIDGEVVKINKLIPKGAKGYYLLTNVRGTSHLDVGSKDKVNKILEENVSIPSICWWREDITMLFEKDPMFKWSFPEIIHGQDILNSALFDHLNESKERRQAVIRAYLADQYKLDNEVKFRQIDLQNRLLDLFTDVPVRAKKFNQKNKLLTRTLYLFEESILRTDADEHVYWETKELPRAAAFLLHPKVQNGIPKILLEGGPGQGKSTITQYVCQVHRARLLNKIDDLNLLPEAMKKSPIKLPLKIDLRHVAAWVEKKNPYQGSLSDDNFSKTWAKSLESFLTGHIVYHSNLDFSSNDLVAIFKSSSILFVFDGFDEIANLEVRKEVIEFINKGLNRIAENTIGFQVIITSRPSVFSDSLGFSADTYPHFELANITPDVTKEYVDKWIKANRLDSKEAAEIKRLVDEKLEMPHLKELAKSPMQLAIFISLLRTKGESLPNKRTALYDSYIELLFDREAEKSSLVRDHRDLIIDIHQYLAWILHSEAELYQNSGTIKTDDLIQLLETYLTKEGHKVDIAAKLFDVVKDRVCALASRIQGTYEFEVQPLREYFCAKFLYKTSPYSPAGNEKPGTLPDRFEGISRNFYWQNVVRFFAGCLSKGELSMLIQKLKEIQNDKVLKYTNYPRILTSQLLADYVFKQYPLLLRDVVKIIIDGINIGNVINQESSKPNTEPIILPIECGRQEIVEECFKELKKFPTNYYQNELIGIIKNNPYKTIEQWLDYSKNIAGAQLTMWLHFAYYMEILYKIHKEVLERILLEGNENDMTKRIQILVQGGRLDAILENKQFKKAFVEGILNNDIYYRPKKIANQSTDFLSIIFCNFLSITNIFTRANSIGNLEYYLIRSASPRYASQSDMQSIYDFGTDDDLDLNIKKFASSISSTIDQDLAVFRTQIEPWSQIVQNARNIYGNCWVILIMANISGAIKNREDKLDEFENLNDTSLDLCKRVRYARLKSGSISYWQKILGTEGNERLKILTFLTWATPKTIIALISLIGEKVQNLERKEYQRLARALHKCTAISYFTKSQEKTIREFLLQTTLNHSLIYLLSLRFVYEERIKLLYETLGCESNIIEQIKNPVLDYLTSEYIKDAGNESLLEKIRVLYREGGFNNIRSQRYLNDERVKIPLHLAQVIMSDCKSYPGVIVTLAERTCRMDAYTSLVPVGEIAKKENWFSEFS